MADLLGFSKLIRLRGEAVEKNTTKLVRKVALAIDAAVVMATPVDTGRARANWRVQVGGANGESLGSPASPAAGAQQALDEGRSAVAAYQSGEIHITNNLPYIGRLNDGSSAQAPAGFVERAVVVGVNAVRSAKGLSGDLDVEGA
jgi:hypothetical protein